MSEPDIAIDVYELRRQFAQHVDAYVDRVKRGAVADRRGEITFRHSFLLESANDVANAMIGSARYMITEWERDADAKKRLAASLDKIIDTSDDQKIVLEAIQTKSQLLGMIR